MSTHNICFYGQIKKILTFFIEKKKCLNSVLALTVKIRKSQNFLARISGSPGDQIFSLTFRNSTSVFLNSHLWSKTALS